jgi:hypothetical protein
MPPFMAHLGNNDDTDGPAPSDHTPTADPVPNMAMAHHITNCVRHEIDTRLNPVISSLNALITMVQRIDRESTEHVCTNPPTPTPPVAVTQAVPAKAVLTPACKPSQNIPSSNPPVLMVAPDPCPPVTCGQGGVESGKAPKHVPVTDATSEVPAPTLPSLTVDAVEFPSLEETRPAIPSHRVKCNAENKAARERQWRQVPGVSRICKDPPRNARKWRRFGT